MLGKCGAGWSRGIFISVLGFRASPGKLEKCLVLYRGIVTGIYTTSSPEACQYIAQDSHANVIVVDSQKQLEKILKV